MAASAGTVRVRKANLTEKAYRYLEEQIAELRIAPGERIGEAEVARRLRMSRGPVREALRKLESAGLVVREEFCGARVAEFDEKELDELDALRSHLLALVGRLAAERAAPGQIGEMRRLIEKMESAVGEEDYTLYSELNLQFHALLNEAGGNSKLSFHLAQVYRQIRRYNLIAMSFREGMVDSMESHRKILAAVEAGDAAAAERELAGHGRLSYQVLRSNFKKLRRAFRPEAHPPRRNGKGRDRNGAGGRPSGG
ncbi:MAG: GntR family transcriptional regulator [bacterium]